VKRSGTLGRLLALGVATFGIAAGCRSVPTPPSGRDGGVLAQGDSLDEASRGAARQYAAYATGIHHEALGEAAEAEKWYREALAADPANGAYAARVARAMAHQRNIRGALEFAEAFAAEHPGTADIPKWLAAAYAEAGEWDRSEKFAEAAARAAPEDPEAWELWAAVAGQRGRGNPAREAEVLERGLEAAEPPTPLRHHLVRAYNWQCEGLEDDSPEASALHLKMIDQLRAIEEETPGEPDTVALLAALLLFEGRPDEGLRALARLERIQPGNGPEAWKTAAQMTPARHAEKTVEALRRLRDEGGAPQRSWLLEAVLEENAGHAGAATAAMDRALAETPHDVELWIRYASADGNEPERVLAILKRALRANPDHPSLLELRGVTQLLMHRYSAAERDLLKAAGLFERDGGAEPHENFPLVLALVLTRTGKHAEAAEWLERAYDRNGNEALEAFVGDASFSTARGHRGMAKTMQAFIGRAPDPDAAATGRVYLALACMNRGQYKAAVREFERNAGYYPDPRSVPARLAFMHAMALDLAGRKDEAVRRFVELAETHPGFAEARNYLAYTWAEAGEHLDEARQHVGAALAKDPGNAAYIDTLAWIEYKTGEFEEAWENILQAELLRPGDPEIEEHKKAIRAALDAQGGKAVPEDGEAEE